MGIGRTTAVTEGRARDAAARLTAVKWADWRGARESLLFSAFISIAVINMGSPVLAEVVQNSIAKVCGSEIAPPVGAKKVRENSKDLDVYSKKVPDSDRYLYSIIDSENCRIVVEGTEILFVNLSVRAGYLLPPFEIQAYEGLALNRIIQAARMKASVECGALGSFTTNNGATLQDQCVSKHAIVLRRALSIFVLQEWDSPKSFWEVVVFEGRIVGALHESQATETITENIVFD